MKRLVTDGIANTEAQRDAAISLGVALRVYNQLFQNPANAGHFDYEKTIIVDWHGSVNKSLELAMLLEIDPNNIIVYDNKSKPLNFTLVIGKDWFEKKELLERLNDT